MTIWQVVFSCSIWLAVWHGRPRPVVAVAIIADFAASMFFSGDMVSVAVADVAAAALIVGKSTRCTIIAALFIAMLPIYYIGQTFGLSYKTSYGLVYALGYAQLLIMGRADDGLRKMFRHRPSCVRYRNGRRVSVPASPVCKITSCRDHEEG